MVKNRKIRVIFQPDPINSINDSVNHFIPEHTLLAALVENAWRDILPKKVITPNTRRLAEKAIQWFRGDLTDIEITYQYCVEHLCLSSSTMRAIEQDIQRYRYS